jgi:DNA-binding CsgD family transcriptional regulator
MDRDEALRIVDALYAAALGEADWLRALALISDSLEGRAATLEIHDAIDGKLLHFHSFGIDSTTIPVYVRDFSWNSRVSFMSRARDSVGFDHLFLTEAEINRDPFYMEFLAPAGLRYFVSAHSPLIAGRVKGTISVQRSGRVRGPAPDHIKAMRLLQPHIARALRLYWTRCISEIDPSYFDRRLGSFGLTGAERRLAAALAFGETLSEYARRNCLSINTVYTHYRRTKEKMGAGNQAALVARLYMLARNGENVAPPKDH